MDWSLCKADFEWDGSFRDIHVPNATIADWKTVLALLTSRYHARLELHGEPATMPDVEQLFGSVRHWLGFEVGAVSLACHFFEADAIELTFDPRGVNEATLQPLLSFMAEVGDALGKRVIMTPENGPSVPIFEYDPIARTVRWLPLRGG